MAVDVVVVEVYPLANRTIAVLPGEGGFVVVPMSGSSAAVVRVALRTFYLEIQIDVLHDIILIFRQNAEIIPMERSLFEKKQFS